ncbi:MAG: hypothetical protein CM15mV25_0380 [uncultured marine virus]|nr:MAG: hypothetical protein CM15mV25_0380 [uncultured marine virus]
MIQSVCLNTSYVDYYKWMREFYPEITSYNIVNFLRYIYYMNLLKSMTSLYLDFDVVPNTDKNFFEVCDLSKVWQLRTITKE